MIRCQNANDTYSDLYIGIISSVLRQVPDSTFVHLAMVDRVVQVSRILSGLGHEESSARGNMDPQIGVPFVETCEPWHGTGKRNKLVDAISLVVYVCRS